MSGVLRREFLGALAGAPLAIGQACVAPQSCILLVLTGGPSQLDTFDLKPEAPREIRGPFRPIRTNVPGIEISEIFPRMARHADKFALIRSVYSDASPVHEDGLRELDSFIAERTLPGPIGFMGSLASACEHRTSPAPFAEDCQRARQLVERGAAFVRVNMFDTVFHRATWDCHGTRPFSRIADYKETVGPAFDLGFGMLLEDLHQRGLLDTTLVVAMGEFGRTPRINPSGGRDHWAKCRTVVMAGGGIRGGQVYGSSDAIGAEPKDNPVSVERIMATLGVRNGAEPIRELFG